jgi:hypothetical protein
MRSGADAIGIGETLDRLAIGIEAFPVGLRLEESAAREQMAQRCRRQNQQYDAARTNH